MAQSIDLVADTVDGLALDLAEDTKPRLRGCFHAVAAPVALAAGVPLVAASPAGPARCGTVVFMVSVLLNFSVSAAMHRGRWSAHASRMITRLDHASIFLVIAGSYTPIALLLLHGRHQWMLLTMIWTGAALGTWFRIAWTDAPRSVCVAVYMGLGMLAVFFVGDIAAQSTPTVMAMLATACALYTGGAFIYALQGPNPLPRWVGFHELFHALTVLGFTALYTAIAITVHSLPVNGPV